MNGGTDLSGRQAQVQDINFLVLGGQRCGSTWLYEALKEHPQIYLPSAKQTHFFDESYHNGIEWYLRHFTNVQNHHIAIGEVSTGYCMPAAIKNVHAEFPNIKLIMVMRHPTERANSYFRSRAPHNNWNTLKQALEEDETIILRGQYADHLDSIQELYKQEQLLLLVYDDLQKDELAYIKRVYEFLGVDPQFSPSVIGTSVRAAMFPRTRRILKRLGLNFIVNSVNFSPVGDALRRIVRRRRTAKKITQNMPMDIRTQLINHFEPYNRRLEKILNRDLSSWDK